MKKIRNRHSIGIALCLLTSLVMTTEPSVHAQQSKDTATIRRSIVKIINTYSRPNSYQPWRWSNPLTSVGSGFIIKGNYILTNAHIVSDSTFLQVQKENDPNYYDATVLFLGHDCDLALIAVKDNGFFKGTEHISFGGIPQLQSKVTAYGYPEGGERISITQGVVSRIEIGPYTHSGKTDLLMIQTDAAINPGNSGGPAMQGKTLAGLTFQTRVNASNIGFLIPVPIIKHFLKDVQDGTYHGFPSLGVLVQELQNADHRAYLGMKAGETGILVTHILKNGSAEGVLMPGDIILKIDGKKIANDGSYQYNDGRIRFSNIIDEKQIGESVSISFMRNGAIIEKNCTLRHTPVRIPWYNEFNTSPRYFIFGGIVFQSLSKEFLKSWGDWVSNADETLLYNYFYAEVDELEQWRKEFVVINHVLPDEANTYISGNADNIVVDINGKIITCLEDVLEAVQHPIGKFHVIKVKDSSAPIILNASEVPDADQRIKKNYKIDTLSTVPLKKDIK